LAQHLDLGKLGEKLAKEHLVESGYEILDENWTYKKTEVDLIVYKDKRIVFVEVKTRTSAGFGEPEDFVNESKQSNLQKAADEYIYLMDFNGEIRFDIIAILFDSLGKYQLKHIEDAFWGR
jgi:putative endonuclease